ncbi:glycosyl transferase [Kitasatospora sp. NA04385]|uniref:Glycosyltransferase n=2 Tax=Streptomycetaceae TaxID=2062 RepID=A0ACD6BAC0_9ACTN|nr:macrolide family glycosyltransferase [Kitasatospora sp. NA04385]6J31_A Chain A, kcn28 [Kitasatospora]6J31_B Chain B, kcn28 [Kitasatospora]6J31_C Chain C, kcn28 [Kitasatospora]6J31_D Chain D, kcn28 [Kitasatospora]QDJ74280.1 glycosyltransferase [Kitasatospora sp.]QKW22412.1 glycosyl transferase [Kitasatospora sp. NA04385]
MPRPGHIAMVSVPSRGHLHPSLELIRELVARGHRVTYANDPSVAAAVTETGAELVPYTSALPSTDTTEGRVTDQIAQMDVFLDDAVGMLPQLRAAYEEDRPDVFLYDVLAYPARVLAMNWGIPSIQISPTWVMPEKYRERMAPVVEQLKQDPRGAAHYRRFDAWLEDSGVPGIDAGDLVNLPERSLVLVPRFLQPDADDVDEKRFTFIGPCLGRRAHQGDWKRPAGAEKVALVSLGSHLTNQLPFYETCVEVFAALPDWHLVLQIGRHVDAGELGELPPNVEVHNWVPQLAVLEQADVFVTHGGMGGIQEGLFSGVPMVVAPQANDQPANAESVVGLGIARRIDIATVTPDRLRAAVVELASDPAVAERLSGLRRELRAHGGTMRAADLIERQLPA